ncbi:hypothetical protein PIB30_075228 [Stylosanthes scabra]|uniref:Uncharacterized protein n=1 Tax=Stylosanthes scabra TaxID=79078 RepID=A0ABU6QPI9_9FABA|nr:hypothetical protein [Stylosanthes scabra]
MADGEGSLVAYTGLAPCRIICANSQSVSYCPSLGLLSGTIQRMTCRARILRLLQARVMMGVPRRSTSTLFLLLIFVLSILLQGSASRLINHHHLDWKRGAEERKHSSMFMRSYSAILSSLNSNSKNKKQIHAVSHRLVPSGPNRLHN